MSSRRFNQTPYPRKQKRGDIIFELLEKFAEHRNLQATLKEAAKGAGLIGAASFVGNLLGGKQGMVAGSALATAASYFLLEDTKSVVEIMMEMTREEKQRLVKNMEGVLRGVDLRDATTGLTYIVQNSTMKKAVESKIKSFFEESLDMTVTSASTPTTKNSSKFSSFESSSFA